MKSIFNYNVPKYALDKAEHAYTNHVADNVSVRLIATALLISAGGAVYGGYAVDSTPATYELDTTEIAAEVKADYDSDIEDLKDLKAEIDTLDRDAYMKAYDNDDEARALQARLQSKTLEFESEKDLLVDKMFTDPDMTETAFAEYADIMTTNGFAKKNNAVDPAGLKECQAANPLGDDISVTSTNVTFCMAMSDPDTKKSYDSAAKVAGGILGLLPGIMIGMLVGGLGLPHRREWLYEASPELADYKINTKPKLGNN